MDQAGLQILRQCVWEPSCVCAHVCVCVCTVQGLFASDKLACVQINLQKPCPRDLVTTWPRDLVTTWPRDLVTSWPRDLHGLQTEPSESVRDVYVYLSVCTGISRGPPHSRTHDRIMWTLSIAGINGCLCVYLRVCVCVYAYSHTHSHVVISFVVAHSMSTWWYQKLPPSPLVTHDMLRKLSLPWSWDVR